MRFASRLCLSLALLAGVAGTTGPAAAADAGRECTPVCASWCLKPISIVDRWDDVTPVPGHAGWTNNGVFDRESYTDTNASGIWEPGEPFEDANGNGLLDAEFYHPSLTGYVPDPVPGNFLSGPDGDWGRLLRLRPDAGERNRAGAYAALAFPASNKGTPQRGAGAFRDALAGCESAFIEVGDRLELQPGSMAGPGAEAFAVMVAGDPDARWDAATRTVVGIRDPDRSSRLVLIGLHDPRNDRGQSQGRLRLVKVAAFFIEEPGEDGSLAGRLVRATSAGAPCNCTCAPEEAFLRECR